VSDSVPLALKPDPCQFRDEALAALQRVSRPWTSSYTGNSVPSIQAAVLAGLGVSVLGAHSVQNGMRVVQDELPDLPGIDIMLYGEEKFGRGNCQSFGQLCSSFGSRTGKSCGDNGANPKLKGWQTHARRRTHRRPLGWRNVEAHR
jgi:hypothetical protein